MAKETRVHGASVAEVTLNAYEHAYEQGWTDGLPIIPPSEELVQRFVAASSREARESIGVLPPRSGMATVEVIAVNAVMAGCRPEYMPVIIAALEALTDPAFPLELIQVTTNPMTPLLLLNGPIRHQLDINYGAGCLGPGSRGQRQGGPQPRAGRVAGAGAQDRVEAGPQIDVTEAKDQGKLEAGPARGAARLPLVRSHFPARRSR